MVVGALGWYFAVVATAIFLPLEVHELAKGITLTRALAFAINVAAVVYLLFSKRLFGLRGGREAYDEERRGEQLLDIERAGSRGPDFAGRTRGVAGRRGCCAPGWRC